MGGEYWVAASTLCLTGDRAGAIGDLVDGMFRREGDAMEAGDCLPNGSGGGCGAWREACRGDCEAECMRDPLLLERTRHVAAATEDVDDELECRVSDGEAVIISPRKEAAVIAAAVARSILFRGKRHQQVCAWLGRRSEEEDQLCGERYIYISFSFQSLRCSYPPHATWNLYRRLDW